MIFLSFCSCALIPCPILSNVWMMRDRKQLFFFSKLPCITWCRVLCPPLPFLWAAVLHCPLLFPLLLPWFSSVILYSSLVLSFLWGDPLVFCYWFLFPHLNFVSEFTFWSCQNSCVSLITFLWQPHGHPLSSLCILPSSSRAVHNFSPFFFFPPTHTAYCFFALPSPSKLSCSLCMTSTEACPFIAVNPLDCVLDLI